jgi:nicotinate-nucleotide pyrophosphorylase (carboxylating)
MEVFKQVGASYKPVVAEGEEVAAGTVIATVEGPLASLLTGERCALNFLMHLCGIATHTREAVRAAGFLRVVDTRKTTPLHRALEKHAVRIGGGGNHRFGLFDGILIKDNHIIAAGGILKAVERARQYAHPLVKVEVEVETLSELAEALEAGADVILLDNMDNATLAEAVGIVRNVSPKVLLEASGNMSAERLVTMGKLGIDYVSMGGLIHQARWADLSLRIVGDAVSP